MTALHPRTAYLLAGGITLGLGAWWLTGQGEASGLVGEAAQVMNDLLNGIVRGQRLTSAPYDKTTGVVDGTPEDLAAAAGLDIETYSLARAVSSEEGRASNAVKAAVAWAIVNHARTLGQTITRTVTRANVAAHSGFYGTQRNIDPDEGGDPKTGPSDRYVSSANDPYEGDAQIAAAVLAGTITDTTGGAEYFDRPKGDDNAKKTAAKRMGDGLVLADVAGVDPAADGIRFWRAA